MNHHHPNAIRSLLLCLLALATTSLAGATDVVTGKQILDRYIEAAGGYAAIDAIESLRRTGDLTFESTFTGILEGTIELTLRPRERIHTHSVLGAFTTTTAWDGSTGWEQGPQGFRVLEGAELERLRTQSDLLFASELARSPSAVIERQADRAIDGTAHFVLTVGEEAGSQMTLSIDQESGLVSQTITPIQIPGVGEGIAVMDFWDYRPHRGVMLPDTIGLAVEGVFSTQMSFRETIINGPVDDNLFAPPPSSGERTSP